MLDVVHITFEKLTGLKGTFEGHFICENDLDASLPLVLNSYLIHNNTFVFTNGGKYVYMKLVDWRESINYLEHFMSGRNLLIKEWSYGRGEGIKFTGSPN